MTERGMVVGARRAGLSISKTADLLGYIYIYMCVCMCKCNRGQRVDLI